jgi:hypothetical protein
MAGVRTQASAAPDNIAVRLLAALESDGLIARDKADLASDKLLELLAEERQRTSARRYNALANFAKVVAVIFLLIALWMVLDLLGPLVWSIIVMVPVIIYQVVFLAASVIGLIFAPTTGRHRMYVAYFCAFANLLLIGWIVGTNRQLQDWLAALAEYLTFLGAETLQCIVSLIGAFYFGVLAIVFSSEVFGFFTVVSLSATTSFGLCYFPEVLVLFLDWGMLNQVIFGHLIVVTVFTTLRVLQKLPSHGKLFLKGVDFYCSIALGTALLLGSSPYSWYKSQLYIPYMLLFCTIWAAAMAVYFLADIKAIGSVLSVFAVLTAFDWIWSFSSQAGAIFCCVLIAAMLYGGVILLEGPAGVWLWLHCKELWQASDHHDEGHDGGRDVATPMLDVEQG